MQFTTDAERINECLFVWHSGSFSFQARTTDAHDNDHRRKRSPLDSDLSSWGASNCKQSRNFTRIHRHIMEETTGKAEQPSEIQADTRRSELQTTPPDKSLPPCNSLFKFKRGRWETGSSSTTEVSHADMTCETPATAEMCSKNRACCGSGQITCYERLRTSPRTSCKCTHVNPVSACVSVHLCVRDSASSWLFSDKYTYITRTVSTLRMCV